MRPGQPGAQDARGQHLLSVLGLPVRQMLRLAHFTDMPSETYSG